MRILSLLPSNFGACTYLLISGSCAYVTDPSVPARTVLDTLRREGATLQGILLTHGHFDHIGSIDELRDEAGVPVYIHAYDAEMLTDGSKNASRAFFGNDLVRRPADVLLASGDTLPLGDETIEVIHTPGHTKGSVCYKCGNDIISGDTLFADGFGRCDLWGGDLDQMRLSLKKLRAFPAECTIYSGHGGTARLGHALDNVAYYT